MRAVRRPAAPVLDVPLHSPPVGSLLAVALHNHRTRQVLVQRKTLLLVVGCSLQLQNHTLVQRTVSSFSPHQLLVAVDLLEAAKRHLDSCSPIDRTPGADSLVAEPFGAVELAQSRLTKVSDVDVCVLQAKKERRV